MIIIYQVPVNQTPFLPRGHWDNVANQRSFMSELAKKLQITEQAGWYSVSSEVFKSNQGYGLLMKYGGSLNKMLQSLYPEYLYF